MLSDSRPAPLARMAAAVARASARNRRTLPLNATLFTAPLATATAVLLLPADPAVPGSLAVSAWVLTLGILGGLAVDLIDEGLIALFRAQHVMVLGILTVVYIEAVQSWYATPLPGETVARAFWAIGAFVTAIAFGASFRPTRLPRVLLNLASRDYSTDFIYRALLLFFTLAMLKFASASDFNLDKMASGLLADRWSAPWSRGRLGDWTSFRDFLEYFGYVVPTFTVMLALKRRGWSHPQVWLGMICSAIVLAFISQSGGRRLPVMIIGAALLTWLCIRRKELRFKNYVAVLLLLAAVVIFLDFMLEIRNYGFSPETGRPSYSVEDFRGIRADDNLHSLAQTLHILPDEHPFVGLEHLWYVIVRPIPRVLWTGKPVTGGFDLALHLGAPGVAFSISAVGECYMCFGWAGIWGGGFLFGLLAKSWSQLLDTEPTAAGVALYATGCMALFLAMRSLLDLILMSYPILCWIAVDLIVYHRRSPAELATAAFPATAPIPR